jgi:hypothetical protein
VALTKTGSGPDQALYGSHSASDYRGQPIIWRRFVKRIVTSLGLMPLMFCIATPV